MNVTTSLKIISLLSLILGILLCTSCFLLFAWEDNLCNKIDENRNTAKLEIKALNIYITARVRDQVEREIKVLDKIQTKLANLNELREDWKTFRPTFYTAIAILSSCGLLIMIPSACILCASDKGAKKFSKYWIVIQGIISLLILTSTIAISFHDNIKEKKEYYKGKYVSDLMDDKEHIYWWFFCLAGIAMGVLVLLIMSACCLEQCKGNEEEIHQARISNNRNKTQDNHNISNRKKNKIQNHGSGMPTTTPTPMPMSEEANKNVVGFKPTFQLQRESQSEASMESDELKRSSVAPDSNFRSKIKAPRPVTRFELKCMTFQNKIKAGISSVDNDSLVEEQFL